MPRLLIGLSIKTTLEANETAILWRKFMPRRKEIHNLLDSSLYSIQEYDIQCDWSAFTPQTSFTKWAAIEVTSQQEIPTGMESLTIQGLYAVFVHKGTADEFHRTLDYIFNSWMPSSGYQFDHRPQFEIMKDDYLGPSHPDSREEVWIPILPILSVD